MEVLILWSGVLFRPRCTWGDGNLDHNVLMQGVSISCGVIQGVCGLWLAGGSGSILSAT